jgi:sugar phosphate isomerase/epimerase
MKHMVSRRSFLTATAAAPLVQSAFAAKQIPVGIELYSVRTEMAKDVPGSVRAVAKMGYPGVEFYGSYYQWTSDYAKEIRKFLDELNIKCYSTHNGSNAFDPENIAKSIELNSILGSKQIIMASAGRVEGLDGWKKVADKLNAAAEKFRAAGMSAGFHNHQVEFRPIEGTRPIEVLAKNTTKDVVLQLDVGTCVEVGYDPVEWIRKNPGRIRSVHCKDYSRQPGKGYRVLFGEGDAPWKQIFEAAESVGGVEFYLIEQEGYDLPPFETVEKCLANFKKLRA